MSARLVFITGASSGIGQALAAACAARGDRLALVARNAQALQRWADETGLGPDRGQVYPADVADPAAVRAAARACIARQGLPDWVIANAGISVGVDLAIEADLEVMQRTLQVNLMGVAATFQPFIAPMRERGSGRLVGVASVAAVRGLAGHAAYCASKAGVVQVCESLRVELRGSGVGVSTLIPGYVSTPLTARNPYAMPFRIEADDFARRALRVLDAGRSRAVIPWPMAVVARVMAALPDAVYDRLASGRGRKPRQSPS